MKTKKIIKWIIILILLIPVFIWVFALSKNLTLTLIHKDKIESMQFIETEGPLPEFEWYRITSYSKEEIEIYFVETVGEDSDHKYKIGGTVSFYKMPGGWHMTESISWSGAGSADNYVWPYWYHVFLA